VEKLYFIAISPPRKIIDEIRIFKEDFAQQYNNSKALKNEAHITLLPPFSRNTESESDITEAFRKIDTDVTPFEIVLNGFGSFPNPKHPVIFVKPETNSALEDLHLRVQHQFNFNKRSFNPHITVGYRDLSFENYLKAWEIYKNKAYKTKFTVDKIILFRHDGKWIPIDEKTLNLF